MLVQIGKRPEARDVVELLLECHERIRKFTRMAHELAAARAADPDEIRQVAGQVRRYFVESLPLHVEDEEQDVLPRLTGRDREVDRALADMRAEHAAHGPLVTRLVDLCEQLVRDPRQLAARTDELGGVAGRLTSEFEAHLASEERVIFPALRGLPSSARDEILAAVRRRRARVLG
jgi:iron-sulfur cluster repair protein YtfE (RIC family)